ncbi:VOC family protein [Aridibaculum aurantiacum]|uniref:VOC family protein n=1 Tax=Aridibaculum aurantiacum TaxID=2810307 RepID=UPI001A9666DD|nr:VOC family protein [Aridibaculum aurantiacum]
MQKITPFLWFNDNAEEAIEMYTGIFKNSEIGHKVYNNGSMPGAKGSLFTATFWLEGQQFMALNGGPMFSFSPAISLFVNCETQEEVDELWEKLSAGGQQQRCGWLQDKFGVSWQIIPSALQRLIYVQDAQQAKRVMDAMLQMNKMDIAKLEEAARMDH